MVNGITAANLLLQEFSKNFSIASDISPGVNTYISKESAFQSYCSELLIAVILASLSPTNSTPDDISIKIIKIFSQFIIRPLNIVFQLSLYAGKFPDVWKHSIIIPLYKGRGKRSYPSSYIGQQACVRVSSKFAINLCTIS